MGQFSGNIVASITVAGTPNSPSISAPLQIVESGLLEINQTFTTTTADQNLVVSIANTTALHYILITFQAQGGSFKVLGTGGPPNNDAQVIPMQAGGSIQFAGRGTGNCTAQVFLNAVMDTGTSVNTLGQLLITPAAVGLNVQLVCVYDPTP